MSSTLIDRAITKLVATPPSPFDPISVRVLNSCQLEALGGVSVNRICVSILIHDERVYVTCILKLGCTRIIESDHVLSYL